MTNLEVLKDLRSRPKPYVGIMPQSTYSETLSRIAAGKAKLTTTKAFLARFGFVGDYNNWRKR